MKPSFFTSVAMAAALVLCSLNTGRCQSPERRVLIHEGFEDRDLAQRKWYDITRLRLAESPFSGKTCIEYEWTQPKAGVDGSSPMRRLFDPTDRVYIRFYLRLSKDWGWSGRDYHPHLIQFMTTENSQWHGPGTSHLTVYVEPANGKLRLAAQDIQNRDQPHGLTQGPLKGGYNGKFYDSREPLFVDDAWHCIEAFYQLNTLNADGTKSNADGVLQGWFDGKLMVDEKNAILRSPDFPKMKFNQLLLAPFFGPGLVPHAQKLWIDDLVVATERIEAADTGGK